MDPLHETVTYGTKKPYWMANDQTQRGRKNRGYIIHKANILSLQGLTTLFAIQQGGFCTLGGFVQETQ